MTDQQSSITVRKYFDAPEVQSRFASVLGERGAGNYIASVLLTVANTPALQDCTPASIYTSALRAATLRLSVDPATKQAYLVPFNSRNGKQAQLIVGYKGLYDMALRTGHYKRLDAYPLYEGEGIEEDRVTGALKITGGKQSKRVSSWLAIFEFTQRFGGGMHYVHMTCEEIHEHARRYSKGYDKPDGPWKNATAQMERKTVLRILLNTWGFLDPMDAQVINEIEDSQDSEAEIIEGEAHEITEAEYDSRARQAEIMDELGY